VAADPATAGLHTVPSALAAPGVGFIESPGLRLDLDLERGAIRRLTHK
jgi:hypothetical protein